MDEDEIMMELNNDDFSDASSITLFHNLSDSDDPSVHTSDMSSGSECDEEYNYISNRPTTAGRQVGSTSTPNIPGTSRDHSDHLYFATPPANSNNLSSNHEHVQNRPGPVQNQNTDRNTVIQTTRPRDTFITWEPISGNLNNFDFLPNSPIGLNFDKLRNVETGNVLHYYRLFLTDQMLDLLVRETNRYAEQRQIMAIIEEQNKPHSMLVQWKDVTRQEILTFIGIILWMGLDTKPSIRDYWSKNALYANNLSKIMPRSRFESILTFIHVADNEEAQQNDRLHKVQGLINLLVQEFQSLIVPDKAVCIDETMVPFRGRIKFRQYIPNKRHKYGLKIFKLCLKGGYTWSLKVYAGKEGNAERANQEGTSTRTTKIVMDLMRPILGEGRVLYTDNFYTSVDLAHCLNNEKTHLVGTLRQKRKHNPVQVTNAKLVKGDMVGKQSNSKIIVCKWKDKRDVLFLTTESAPTLVDVPTRNGPVKKPSTIVEYNSAKSFIDISDQLASYNTPLRRGVKWYRKIIFELLANTSVVNAHAIYKLHNPDSKMKITEFRENLTLQLLFGESSDDSDGNAREHQPRGDHRLEEVQKKGRCVMCYEGLSKTHDRKYAQKHTPQVRTACPSCPQKKFICMKCFFDSHKCFKK